MRFGAGCFFTILVALAAGTSSADARSHHGHGHHQGFQPAAAISNSRDTAKTGDHAPPQGEIKAQAPQGQSGQELKPANDVSTQNDADLKGEHGRHGLKAPAGPKGESARSSMPEHPVTPGNAHAGTSDEIDTRITTVQPRWRNGKAQKQQHSKFVLVKPTQNVSPHRPAAAGAGKNISRNSVGVELAHPRNERGQNERDHDLARPGGPVSAGVPVPAGATGNSPDNARSVDHMLPQPKMGAKFNPLPFNTGTINPSGPMRPHNGPRIVGGSPKLMAGISGNMFRPKY